MIARVGGSTNAYRDAIHQIVTKLKRNYKRAGTINPPGKSKLQKEAGELLHKLLREVNASKSLLESIDLLRKVGVDQLTAVHIVQHAFNRRSQEQKQLSE